MIYYRGPTIGGIITTHATWRWVFYFNLPCCGFVIALILVSWPKTPSPGRITLRQLDLMGCLLFIVASVPLVFALQEGGAQVHAWKSAAVVVCLVLSGTAIVVLGFWIWFFSKPNRRIVPLFPQKIVAHRIMFANLMSVTSQSSISVSLLTDHLLQDLDAGRIHFLHRANRPA